MNTGIEMGVRKYIVGKVPDASASRADSNDKEAEAGQINPR
jgi:hypothetical protein